MHVPECTRGFREKLFQRTFASVACISRERRESRVSAQHNNKPLTTGDSSPVKAKQGRGSSLPGLEEEEWPFTV